MRYIFLIAGLLCAMTGMAQNKQANPAVKNDVTYTRVDKMPEAGYDVNKYFLAHFHCKDESVKYKGRLVFKVMVNEDGSIADCQLMKGIGGKCDQDALTVMKYMPKWKPGMKDGKSIKAPFVIGINVK